ncbi:hypothetical protein T492DRAFT_918556 [Pavlovales sp. CCMP2436]|nr:hypothetical protein T492DRAFT_918556 [Pavlovales sp. CCMP2436]
MRRQEERQRNAGQVRRTYAHLYKVIKNGRTQVMVHTPSNKFISATKWHQIFYDAATDVAERKDPTLALHTGWFVTYLNRFHARASNLDFAQMPAPDITPSVLTPLETDEDMSVASLLADEHAPAAALYRTASSGLPHHVLDVHTRIAHLLISQTIPTRQDAHQEPMLTHLDTRLAH